MLTERQREVLDFIVAFSEGEAMPPTLRDICSEFGYRNTNAAAGMLEVLEAKGFIERSPGLSRGIRVLDEGSVKTCWGRMPIGDQV